MAEQIVTSKEESFARFTITSRVPQIVNDIIDNNQFSPEIEKDLNTLQDSIPAGKLEPLDPDYPFAADINQTLADNPEYGWLNAPFLFIENYLYHKIAEICAFYSNGIDYFHYKKEAEFRKGLNRFSKDLQSIASLDSFSEICLLNLMGNKADLSQNSSYYSSDSASKLLIDHRNQAAKEIEDASQIDIVLDNAGEELFSDLLLAYWLLSHRAVQKVKLHFKQMPYFVSDALIPDYRFLMKILSEKEESAWFVRDMNGFEEKGKLELSAHPFFVRGKPYSQMPSDLSDELSQSDLIIFKGDLNYRRLVGDNYWPYETKTPSIVNYFQSDILISRILKIRGHDGPQP